MRTSDSLPRVLVLTVLLCVCPAGQAARAQGKAESTDTVGEPPVVPVGLDAYRQWDKWPQQRIGVRAYMRSTYDRTGLNEGADASHFLYQKADDFNVTLDVAGSGILYFARYNHWHGSPWHYVVDGTDHIVQESSSATPDKPVANSTFEPKELFPNPLTWTWSDTKGADLMWVPIPFERSFQMGVLAHALRDRVLHLPPVRAGDASVATDPGVGREDAAGRRRASTHQKRPTNRRRLGEPRGED